MKILAIKDDTITKNFILGYLFYYENQKSGYIELSDEAGEWDLPIVLEHFARNHQRSVTSYWTMRWVQQRIVPPDRQNISQILKECGLAEYNEFELLIRGDGRCAQDECYVEKIMQQDVPQTIIDRRHHNITECVLNEDKGIFVTLENDDVLMLQYDQVKKNFEFIDRMLAYASRLTDMKVVAGGSSISWGEKNEISRDYVLEVGQKLPISASALRQFAAKQIVSTTEVMEMLDCTRQNVNDLVKRGKLDPLDIHAKTKLFYRKDVIRYQNERQ